MIHTDNKGHTCHKHVYKYNINLWAVFAGLKKGGIQQNNLWLVEKSIWMKTAQQACLDTFVSVNFP